MLFDGNAQQCLEWPRLGQVRQLPPVDLACVGASSGGFLSFSGSHFALLTEKGLRLRVLDRRDHFGGDIQDYHIFGNTPCRDLITGIHADLYDQLMQSEIGRLFRDHEDYSCKLPLLGALFNQLGAIMTAELRAKLPFFEHRGGTRVVALQNLEAKGFRVFGYDEREGVKAPFWFDAEQVYLGLGCQSKIPPQLEDLSKNLRFVSSLEAMKRQGQERIQSLCTGRPDAEIHIIGVNHGAAALLTELTFGPRLKDHDIPPDEIYNASINQISRLTARFADPDRPKMVLWHRGPLTPKRIAIRASSDEEAKAKSAAEGYQGMIYASIFEEKGRTIYNSHNGLERPHAALMLAAMQGHFPGITFRRIPEQGFTAQLAKAAAIVCCTGIRPRQLPLFDHDGRPLPRFRWPQKGRHPHFEGSGKPAPPGIYLNGIGGAQPVDHVVDHHVIGNGEDLQKAYATGIQQSRQQGNQDLATIVQEKKRFQQSHQQEKLRLKIFHT